MTAMSADNVFGLRPPSTDLLLVDRRRVHHCHGNCVFRFHLFSHFTVVDLYITLLRSANVFVYIVPASTNLLATRL